MRIVSKFLALLVAFFRLHATGSVGVRTVEGSHCGAELCAPAGHNKRQKKCGSAGCIPALQRSVIRYPGIFRFRG